MPRVDTDYSVIQFLYRATRPIECRSMGDLDEILQWCVENLKGNWSYNKIAFYAFSFATSRDFTLFKMFWTPRYDKYPRKNGG